MAKVKVTLKDKNGLVLYQTETPLKITKSEGIIVEVSNDEIAKKFRNKE